MDWIKFGQQLKKARERKGLKQEDIARLVNMTPAMISCLENASKKTNVDTLVMLSKAMDIDLLELF